MNLETPQHECGVIGIFSPDNEVGRDLYYGLIALQNRGQESSGICTFDHIGHPHLHKGMGLVLSVFREDEIRGLAGKIGVGHNRYGTTGGSSINNAQPLLIGSELGEFSFVHNGNLINTQTLRDKLSSLGIVLSSTSDSEVIAKLIAITPGKTMVEKIQSASRQLEGAYSCVIATKNSLIGFRDPFGIWPLSLGRLNGGYILASETNPIERVGGEVKREIKNGEIIEITNNGLNLSTLGQQKESLCSFEFFYFSEPYSKLLGQRVAVARRRMGELLFKEHPFGADMIIPIPETARMAAEGYAEASGIPLHSAIIRNRWIGRTFIQPSQRLREQAAELKYGPIPEVVKGKVVNLVDDSIVRGTTTRRIVRLLREAGAKAVNFLITAPPITDVCWFGIDTADKSELIAASKSIPEIAAFIGADNLGYLSLASGLETIGTHLSGRLCTSCFTGKYSMTVPQSRDKFVLETQSNT